MHRHVLGRGIAKRGWMHKAHMRRINQIFRRRSDNGTADADVRRGAYASPLNGILAYQICATHRRALVHPSRPRQFRFVLQPEMHGYRRVRAYWSDQEHVHIFQPRQTSFRDNRIGSYPQSSFPSKAVTVDEGNGPQVPIFAQMTRGT